MKISYNWLKEFVDIPASPEEIASRLALSGTNGAGVEHGPHGAVIDAEVSSNRPDCLGMLGIARELSAVYRVPLETISPKPKESASAKASDAVRVKIDAPAMPSTPSITTSFASTASSSAAPSQAKNSEPSTASSASLTRRSA